MTTVESGVRSVKARTTRTFMLMRVVKYKHQRKTAIRGVQRPPRSLEPLFR